MLPGQQASMAARISSFNLNTEACNFILDISDGQFLDYQIAGGLVYISTLINFEAGWLRVTWPGGTYELQFLNRIAKCHYYSWIYWDSFLFNLSGTIQAGDLNSGKLILTTSYSSSNYFIPRAIDYGGTDTIFTCIIKHNVNRVSFHFGFDVSTNTPTLANLRYDD